MQLKKLAFLLLFPCLLGAQVYNPSNNLPSSASFPGHNAMGASGAINTGQWDQGFGPSGPTRNMLNLQETDTTAGGENGLLSVFNWSPVGTATGPLAAVAGQIYANFDSAVDASGTNVNGVVGSVILDGTTKTNNVAVGISGYAAATGTAPINVLVAANATTFIEANAHATLLKGVSAFVEMDTGSAATLWGIDVGNYVDAASGGVTTAADLHLQDGGSTGAITHAYAIKSEDLNPSTFAGLIATSKGTAVTSATSITPTGQIFHVTGTTAVATIVAPAGCTDANQGCQLTLIPDAAFTTTAAGNIALASTAVLNKALIMTYDSGTSKWYPSY